MNLIGYFIIIYLIEYIFIVRLFKDKKSKKSKKTIRVKKEKKIPVEVEYLILKYSINIKEISVYSLVRLTSLINAFYLALGCFILEYIDNSIINMMLLVVALLCTLIVTYNFLGKYLQRKKE